eukprot:TRINITY_DN12677_c5_g2_i4.p1 TRINITY_DN12677_c5_g2~~TRINITY_DN12677_c5_g2_i4.p1  ORF type:complete len:354 (+),score=47.00 TRINITY_DN12677_c5_g2_i4:77-1138(+)
MLSLSRANWILDKVSKWRRHLMSKYNIRNVTTSSEIDLVEIGRLGKELPESRPYEPGQLFIHRSLGYRGIILTPWQTQLVQYPTQNEPVSMQPDLHGRLRDVEEGEKRPATFYQALTNAYDQTNVRIAFATKTWSDPKTKMLNNSDYVHHDDILPFHTADDSPHSFLYPDVSDPFSQHIKDGFQVYTPSKALQPKIDATLDSLANSRAYRSVTRNIQVTVLPFYQGHKDARGSEADDKPYMWYYKVLIENKGDQAVQLISRRWVVISQDGERNYLSGRGIVRQLPILSPKDRAFQFTSCVSLSTPTGIMGGSFVVSPLHSDRSNMAFSIEIPTFSLESSNKAADAKPRQQLDK